MLGGQQPFQRSLEDVLARAVADLELARHRERELHHLRVEERRARFERRRHAHAIDLHEDVVGEVDAEIGVELTIEQIVAAEPRQRIVDRPIDVASGDRLLETARVQPALRRRGQERHPAVVRDLRRRARQAVHEPARLVDQPLLLLGRRHQAEHRVGRARRGRRHQAVPPCRQRLRFVGVVAAEQLVAAVAGQHDLHVLARDLRDEERREQRDVGERLVEMVRPAVRTARGRRS